MKPIDTLNAILAQMRPFLGLMALVLGLMAAWSTAVDLVPVLGQVWRPRGGAQTHAIVGACLAIIGGRA